MQRLAILCLLVTAVACDGDLFRSEPEWVTRDAVITASGARSLAAVLLSVDGEVRTVTSDGVRVLTHQEGDRLVVALVSPRDLSRFPLRFEVREDGDPGIRVLQAADSAGTLYDGPADVTVRLIEDR